MDATNGDCSSEDATDYMGGLRKVAGRNACGSITTKVSWQNRSAYKKNIGNRTDDQSIEVNVMVIA